MTAIPDTIVSTTELAGKYRIQVLTATLGTADDDIVLTEAANKISTIVYAGAHLTGGTDADLTQIQTSWASLTITIKSLKANGTSAADNFTDAAVEVLVIGY